MNGHFTEEGIQMPAYTCEDAKLQMVMRDTKGNHKETPLYKHRNSHNFYMTSAKYEQDCGVMALSHTRWEHKPEWPYWNTVWLYLGKLNIFTLQDATTTPTYTHTRTTYLCKPKDIGTCVFTAVLFIKAKSWKQLKWP